VESGRWLLYRYDPRKAEQGENPLMLDSRSPKRSLEDAMYSENRFKMLLRSKPDEAKALLQKAREDVSTRWHMYQYLAARDPEAESPLPKDRSYQMGNRASGGATNSPPATPNTADASAAKADGSSPSGS
jgi:pyruvate-ferredoxin/flavodoxin oxidoreductase